MDEVDAKPQPEKSVEIVFRDGKWIVRVQEARKLSEISFEQEASANSLADGQRMRLDIYRP
jgi:hypothetical protein